VQMNMTEANITAMVRDVIVHLGLPFTVRSVSESSPARWTVEVTGVTGRLVRFVVPDARPLAMRVAIQQRLQAEP
jgi:hypothetical protein